MFMLLTRIVFFKKKSYICSKSGYAFLQKQRKQGGTIFPAQFEQNYVCIHLNG